MTHKHSNDNNKNLQKWNEQIQNKQKMNYQAALIFLLCSHNQPAHVSATVSSIIFRPHAFERVAIFTKCVSRIYIEQNDPRPPQNSQTQNHYHRCTATINQILVKMIKPIIAQMYEPVDM